ncbi:hypothetical protein ACOSQ2_023157 [Xanthoceras sorbifolium]
MQTILSEIQSIRVTQSCLTSNQETNPFAPVESSRHNHQPLADRDHNHQPSERIQSSIDRGHHHLKLSFPKFNEKDPMGWVYKAEHYFEFKEIGMDQQVQLASFYLEGIALQWHRWLTKFRGQMTWNEFTKALLLRFGPTNYEDPSEALTRLKQTSTVSADQETFKELSHRVDGLLENFLVGCFIAGLRDEIRLDVKIKQPRSLADAIGVARLIEERNGLLQKGSSNFRPSGMTPKALPNNSSGVLGPPPINKPNNSVNPFKRITSQEAKERRKKRLCYYCDEGFVLGHRCQRPQLFMIKDIVLEEDLPEEVLEHVGSVENILPEVSFHAITDTEHPQTIGVHGKLKGKEVTMLIDGGSTYNFVDQSLVTKYGLPITRDKTFQVIIANREKITCMGRCLALPLVIQGYDKELDFYILHVAAVKVFIGCIGVLGFERNSLVL